MEALPWTLRVTVSLPTKVPALGLKATVSDPDWAEPASPKRESAKAGGEDARLDEHATRTRTSTACRARRVHALLALDIRAISSHGEFKASVRKPGYHPLPCDQPQRTCTWSCASSR